MKASRISVFKDAFRRKFQEDPRPLTSPGLYFYSLKGCLYLSIFKIYQNLNSQGTADGIGQQMDSYS